MQFKSSCIWNLLFLKNVLAYSPIFLLSSESKNSRQFRLNVNILLQKKNVSQPSMQTFADLKTGLGASFVTYTSSMVNQFWRRRCSFSTFILQKFRGRRPKKRTWIRQELLSGHFLNQRIFFPNNLSVIKDKCKRTIVYTKWLSR